MAQKPPPTTAPDIPAAVWVPHDRVHGWADNPRHNDGEPVEEVAKSIAEFGWGKPVLARLANGEIIAGHTSMKAGASLDFLFPGQPAPGMIPVRFLDLSEAKAHKLAIVDNKTGELASWDPEKLADELGKIEEAGEDLTELPGFDEEELAALHDDDETPIEGGGPVEQGGPLPSGDFVAFKFGEYGGRVSRPVYESFVTRYLALQKDKALPMLDDVLRAWLALGAR